MDARQKTTKLVLYLYDGVGDWEENPWESYFTNLSDDWDPGDSRMEYLPKK